jgi:hypothetical protein
VLAAANQAIQPDLSGPDLALKLKESRPEMRVILMSGYPGGGMLVLNYGWYSIQKPFVRVQLVAKSNEVLYAEMRDRVRHLPGFLKAGSNV